MVKRFLIVFILWLIVSLGYAQLPFKQNIPLTFDTLMKLDSVEESNFQDYLDNLFYDVDTTEWDNLKINIPKARIGVDTDTVTLVLTDITQNYNFSMPVCNVITSNFGNRGRMFHYGVDLRSPYGDTVKAAFNGIVRINKYDFRSYGNVIVLRHPNGLETIYGHLSRSFVEVNQEVRAGDVIGLTGSTGHSSGPHLHFEVRYKGNPVDPNIFIDFNSWKLKSNILTLTQSNFNYRIKKYVYKPHKTKGSKNIKKKSTGKSKHPVAANTKSSVSKSSKTSKKPSALAKKKTGTPVKSIKKTTKKTTSKKSTTKKAPAKKK